MGLDMYLRAEKYVAGYSFRGEEAQNEYGTLVAMYNVADYVAPDTPSAMVKFTVAYWRKANQVHNWFVQNVQSGEDECRPHYVERSQLEELRTLCLNLIVLHEKGDPTLRAKIKESLPPTEGFFFGSYKIDDSYWYDIRQTLEQLNRVLAMPDDWEFEYQSSW